MASKTNEPINDSISEETRQHITEQLLGNAKSAVMAAIELHNKPIFSYRYETSIILTINAWELAMKAYILKYHKEVKVFEGDWSKEFPNCLNFVDEKLGKPFLQCKENVQLLYRYRCNIIHFYNEKIELILYSLLRPNIIYFSDFVKSHFKVDLSEETNLIVLPIGFKRVISPIDFLTENQTEGSKPVKNMINAIVKSAKKLSEQGFEDGLLCNYNMTLESVTKVKNADIVVGVTKDASLAALTVNKVIKHGAFTHDDNAPKIKIDEESLFKDTFNLNRKDYIKKIKSRIPTFRETTKNVAAIKELKKDANYYREKCLDAIPTDKSIKKGFYSELAVEKAVSMFQP